MKRGIILIAFALLSLVLAQNANVQNLVTLPADVNTASATNFPLPPAYANINTNAQVSTNIGVNDTMMNQALNTSMTTAQVQNMVSQANASVQNATNYAMMYAPQNVTQQFLAGVAVTQAISTRIITNFVRVLNVNDVQANVEHTLSVLYSLNSQLNVSQATNFLALVNSSVAIQQGRLAYLNLALNRSQTIDTLVIQCNASIILTAAQKAQYCNRQNVTLLGALGILNLDTSIVTNLALITALQTSLTNTMTTYQGNLTQFFANQQSYYNGNYTALMQNYMQDYAVLANNLQQARNLTLPSYEQVVANLTALLSNNLTEAVSYVNAQISNNLTISSPSVSCVNATSGPLSTNCTITAVPTLAPGVTLQSINISGVEAAMHAVFVGFTNAAALRLQITQAIATGVTVQIMVLQTELEFVRQTLQNNTQNATLAAAGFVESVQTALNNEIQQINASAASRANALQTGLAAAAQNSTTAASQLNAQNAVVNASLTARAQAQYAVSAYQAAQVAQAQADQSATALAQTALNTYQNGVARLNTDYAVASAVLNKTIAEGQVRVATAIQDAYQTRVDAQNATMNATGTAQQYAQRQMADNQALAEAYLLWLSREQVYMNQQSAAAQAQIENNATLAQLTQYNANVQAGAYVSVANSSQTFQNNQNQTTATLIALIQQFRSEITYVTASWVYNAYITATIVVTDIGNETQSELQQIHKSIITAAMVLLAQNQNVYVSANAQASQKRQSSNTNSYNAEVSDAVIPQPASTPTPTPTTSTGGYGTPSPTPTTSTGTPSPTPTTSTGTPSPTPTTGSPSPSPTTGSPTPTPTPTPIQPQPTPTPSPSSAVASVASVMVVLCSALLVLVF